MRHFLAILVFSTAAAAAAFAGAGVVVAPHLEPPGVPLFHTHVLAAYRLPLFLGVLRARFDPSQGVLTQQSMFDLETTLALALLAMIWPRLPRPDLRALAAVGFKRIARALWRASLPTGPPRSALQPI
jgi:hypothetical protein